MRVPRGQSVHVHGVEFSDRNRNLSVANDQSPLKEVKKPDIDQSVGVGMSVYQYCSM
jgi:hypothetical protein